MGVFAYHRAVAPMMWVLVGLGTIELFVVHFLLMMWLPWLAIVVGAATVASLIWLIWIIRSFRDLPVLVGPRQVVMRAGRLRSVTIPREQIAGLREHWNGAALKDRRLLNLAMIAYPNVVVDLTVPLPGKRQITAVAHRLDDPAGFTAALEALGRST